MAHQHPTIELLLATNDAVFLDEKCLWIAATADNVHTTSHQDIMLNVKAANSTIIMGNGAIEMKTLSGNITDKM